MLIKLKNAMLERPAVSCHWNAMGPSFLRTHSFFPTKISEHSNAILEAEKEHGVESVPMLGLQPTR